MAKKQEKKQPVREIIDPEAKKLALETALQKIEKDFGKGSIMKLGDAANIKIDSISTGSIGLDRAIGIGGLPRGRIIEIYGPESSGKTTVALHCVAQAQKAGGTAAFIDAEHALDPVYARALGVDTDDLIISQPDTGEQALEIVDTLVRSGGLDIVVVDSVAALVPKMEIEGIMGDSFIGLQARLMSQALRKLTGSVNKSNTITIFINQLRQNINGGGFGPTETTTGGRALKFYSSVRLDVRKIETLKQNDQMIGSRTRVKVVKNKIAPPFKQCEFDIMYGKGISRSGEILDLCEKNKIIDKSGSWYSFEKNNFAQGKENAKLYIENTPDFSEKLEKLLFEKFEEEDKKQADKIEYSQEDEVESIPENDDEEIIDLGE